MNSRIIFFVGKPGCGKGTQAKMLAEKTGWRVITAGEQFRTIAAEDTPVGRMIKSTIESGNLVPHWFAMYLYLKGLFSVAADESIIFDGFSRKVAEVELIINSLKWLERAFVVLEVQVSDEEVLNRLAKRKEIEGRADDNVVEERLNEYREHTQPSIEILRKTGMLIEINGEQTPEAIASDIREKLSIA